MGKDEQVQELRIALKYVRSIIADAAMVGFQWQEGDWATRLFASQGISKRALDRTEPPVPEDKIKKAERNAAIVAARKGGMTYKLLAEQFGLTIPRVRQIYIKETGTLCRYPQCNCDRARPWHSCPRGFVK